MSHERCFRDSVKNHTRAALQTFFGLDAPRRVTHRLEAMGKVHGSLARAGKVRGQTPKVAKQEKKKQPKGRAFQRIKYNRRFVNVVVGIGKKRSPNSNQA